MAVFIDVTRDIHWKFSKYTKFSQNKALDHMEQAHGLFLPAH